MYGGEPLPAFPASSLSGLQQLTNLTKLTLSGLGIKWELGTDQHFPQQLQELMFWNYDASSLHIRQLSSLHSLDLHVTQSLTLGPEDVPAQLTRLSLETRYGHCELCLSHLTCLETLCVTAYGGLVNTSLPPSLTWLSLINTPLPTHGLFTLLAHVVHIYLAVHRHIPPPDVYTTIGKLPMLKELRLSYQSVAAAVAAASFWKGLPQLKQFSLYLHNDQGMDSEEFEHGMTHIIREVGLAKSLTQLDMDMQHGSFRCGGHFAQLSKLRSLELTQWSCYDREDLLHLKALTQLTKLSMSTVSVDDVTLVRLLYSFPQLRELDLADCGELSEVVVPVIAHQLTGLTKLGLGLMGVTDSSVPFLVELTQVRWLTLHNSGLSDWAQGRVYRALAQGY